MELSNYTIPLSPLSLPAVLPTVELNERDLAVIYKVAVYKYLSSLQLKRLFWPEAKHQTAAKRLNQLTEAGFLSRRFFDAKASDEPQMQRTAVYYWNRTNQTQLRHYLDRQGEQARWSTYERVIKGHAHVREVSSLFLRHEVGISEIFLNLEAAVAGAGWSLPFWLRTSPKARGISRWVPLDPNDPDGPRVHFAPDALFCLADPKQQLRFGTLEYETKDKRNPPPAYRRKLEGHIAFAEQQLFAELLERLVAAYHIPLRADPRMVGMYTLTVTSAPELRDDLFLACASLRSPDVELLFAPISDITPEGALSPIWLRAPGAAARGEQPPLLAGQSMVVHAPLAKQELATLPRISLGD